MAATDIILNKDMILVKRTNSSGIGVESGSSNWYFGTVEKVYSTCDKYSDGSSVFFDSNNAASFLEGSDTYYIVTEDKISSTESPAP
jgi:hypothetical protein